MAHFRPHPQKEMMVRPVAVPPSAEPEIAAVGDTEGESAIEGPVDIGAEGRLGDGGDGGVQRWGGLQRSRISPDTWRR
eukprot:8016426-Pyramimonas_sp.AAC.1